MKKLLSLILLSFILSTIIAIPVNAIYLNNTMILPFDSYKIPNLNTSFVPQGLCKTTFNGKSYRLITAYDYNNDYYSKIYIINSNGTLSKTIKLRDTAGYHVGGITEFKGEIWIASTNKLLKISKKSLFNAKNGSTITPIVFNKTNIKNIPGNFSFCTSYNDILWIGTFDQYNTSKAYGYTYNSGTKTLKHVATMTIPKKCQGMAFLNSTTVFFSTSHGSANSNIYKYTLKKTTKNGLSTYTLNKKTLTITAPSRSQEIYLTPNKNLYVLFESGSKVYRNKGGLIENRVILIDL